MSKLQQAVYYLTAVENLTARHIAQILETEDGAKLAGCKGRPRAASTIRHIYWEAAHRVRQRYPSARVARQSRARPRLASVESLDGWSRLARAGSPTRLSNAFRDTEPSTLRRYPQDRDLLGLGWARAARQKGVPLGNSWACKPNTEPPCRPFPASDWRVFAERNRR